MINYNAFLDLNQHINKTKKSKQTNFRNKQNVAFILQLSQRKSEKRNFM